MGVFATTMKPKKSLGQNFLIQPAYAEKMIDAAGVTSGDSVLEVGPGKGILTEKLLRHAKKVIAVEKDEALVSLLQEKFAEDIQLGKLLLIAGDILQVLASPLSFGAYHSLAEESFTVIANIPYYITGELIRVLLSGTFIPRRMVLMVQKEVAVRIIARNKKESLLSLSVKAYGTPSYITTVGKRNFFPVPAVDSAILAIDEISRDFFKTIDEKRFFDLLHAGFAHKRKLLVSNLREASSKLGKSDLQTVFERLGIPKNTRAEDLSIETWKNLVLAL